MRLFEKVLVVINIILVVFIVSLFFGWTENLVDNCWGKYQTEEQAISHCETHNG